MKACGAAPPGWRRGHLHAAVGAVLETHRAAQPAGQLAVALAFGGARADRAPAHQVADELRAEQVQEFGAHRQDPAPAHRAAARRANSRPFVDGEAAIQVRVVDVALPAHRGAGLLEVHAHHHQQVAVASASALGLEPACVVPSPVSWSWMEHGPTTTTSRSSRPCSTREMSDAAATPPGTWHRCRHRLPFLQQGGCDQRANGTDAQVVDAGGVVGGQDGWWGVWVFMRVAAVVFLVTLMAGFQAVENCRAMSRSGCHSPACAPDSSRRRERRPKQVETHPLKTSNLICKAGQHETCLLSRLAPVGHDRRPRCWPRPHLPVRPSHATPSLPATRSG